MARLEEGEEEKTSTKETNEFRREVLSSWYGIKVPGETHRAVVLPTFRIGDPHCEGARLRARVLDSNAYWETLRPAQDERLRRVVGCMFDVWYKF